MLVKECARAATRVVAHAVYLVGVIRSGEIATTSAGSLQFGHCLLDVRGGGKACA